MKRTNTGSEEFQINTLTEKINRLVGHFSFNKKDFHSKRGFLKMVSQRKKKLEYLKRKDFNKYLSIVDDLKIRK
ncbi:30S ribosomal protein S15 [Candidatus Riesia pediculischaeffi]|uniref:Small ribosomal subunit protein uS15 n=1 Tax=Candidatus Riesia pediculischaeffi PTSU TaxID=1401651 RepID=A0A0C1V7L6_9ENTR|nr:30S ribosomal protein S15 [Candidatus Riesia pediculischaeffi]KIE63808.1 SSU ribosomal protein S15p (S13e) [Candidatus Riesia pediculischaeffi PTSU]